MNKTFKLQVTVTQEQLVEFTDFIGYTADIPDPVSIKAIEDAIAAGESPTMIPDTIPNPQTRRRYAKEYMRGLIAEKLSEASDANIEQRENAAKVAKKQQARALNIGCVGDVV